MRLRILYGTFLLSAGLGVYALLVMKLAVVLLPEQWAVQLVFYLVTGTLWVYPAAKLTYWMQDLPPPPDRFGN